MYTQNRINPTRGKKKESTFKPVDGLSISIVVFETGRFCMYPVLSRYPVGYQEANILGYYKRIRELREDHDLTQRQIAAMLNMSQPQYFRYEQGYRDIPSDVLIALADIYKTSTDYVLGRTDNPTSPPQKSRVQK